VSYLAALVATATVLTASHFDPETVTIILVFSSMPLAYLPLYLNPVFSLGLNADLIPRESCFPGHLFRLPVETGALAGWHMAYGAATFFLLWVVTAQFILRPWLAMLDMTVPMWWPALFCVATTAWFQALLWSPVGLAGIRIALTAVFIPILIVLAEVCSFTNIPEIYLVGLFAGLAVFGWTIGYVGVRKARQGTVPNWNFLFRPVRYLSFRLPRRQRSFGSASTAQVWFEGRRNGLTLPVFIGLVLPFVLFPLLYGKNDVLPTSRTLLTALALPLFLAGMVGTTVSGKNPWVKDYYGVPPFTATLPMSTAGLVGAKLKAAALSTLATWLMLIAVLVVALALTGTMGDVTEIWELLRRENSPLKIVAGIAAVAVFLMVWTWKRIIDSLLLGLTGRKWVIHASLFGGLFGMGVLGAIGWWIIKHPESHEVVLTWLPWVLALWIACRLLVSGWALRRMLSLDLIKARTVGIWLTTILLLGSVLIGTLAWVVPEEQVPRHYLAFAVFFIFPMVRLAATPLALAWNRHR
jgi:hypothetical protein